MELYWDFGRPKKSQKRQKQKGPQQGCHTGILPLLAGHSLEYRGQFDQMRESTRTNTYTPVTACMYTHIHKRHLCVQIHKKKKYISTYEHICKYVYEAIFSYIYACVCVCVCVRVRALRVQTSPMCVQIHEKNRCVIGVLQDAFVVRLMLTYADVC